MKRLNKIINFLSWPWRNYKMKRRLKELRVRDPFIYK